MADLGRGRVDSCRGGSARMRQHACRARGPWRSIGSVPAASVACASWGDEIRLRRAMSQGVPMDEGIARWTALAALGAVLLAYLDAPFRTFAQRYVTHRW